MINKFNSGNIQIMGIQERKEREKERRRQQIIVAAKRVFSDKGFNKTTMEDIADEAELSPGTLYLYFKNKEELYASLSLRILKYLSIRVEHVKKETHLDAGDKLAGLKEAMYDVYEFDPLTLINMFHLQSSETLKNLSPEFLAELNDLFCSSMSTIADIFKTGIDTNMFIRTKPQKMADIFWAFFSGVILWESSKSLIDRKKDYLKETLNLAFEIFEQGIML
jgi:AcrR family transcriptional regulator